MMMKTLSVIFFCSLLGVLAKTNDMMKELKTHIQNKEVDKVISIINENPDILNLKDNNGSSGLMLIAYSGLEQAFEQAIELKKVFSFHEAIVCGKLNIVREHLSTSNSALINTYSSDGFTPISLASFFNRTEIAKFLLQGGADPKLHAKNPSKVNALHAAIAKENEELCQLFIEKGIDVNAVQTQGVTALHSAVHRGNLNLTQLLVENGAKIELKMDNGDTALMIAQREGHKHIVEYLSSKKD